ncbi:phospholipase/carboxylesterase [Pacificibacter maritimus]|uniref:Phospholipase/carboxylesterase n=2 Tax=Pacificibacter maritimus TaxID=762213 RepID=A0A3N4UM76_9RHOB|nr:alpha/beta fold hydrolase [Pacificibacter maritimus]RPE71553.1 phospholipase/carboxylesterase [Pacificibacter maritimus]
MSVLEHKIKESHSGSAHSVVVFLHGYGANGEDLLGLAEPMAEHMPDTVFYAPDAPEQCIGNPMGFQWFPIPWIDGSSEEEARAGMERASAELNAYLDDILVDLDLEPENMAIVGFSQGTMMALHVAPRREDAVSGVVGFSGRLLEPEMLSDELRVRMPVFLAHGDQDDVVPPQSLPAAVQALETAGFEKVYAHVMEGTAHGIDPDGLSMALAFLREQLGYE